MTTVASDASDVGSRLVTAAAEAFAERGYAATSTRDIAARAGLSPAGMYVHFRSKEELLFRISELGHRGALATLAEVTAVDPGERLRRMVLAFAVWHARNASTARVVNYELAALSQPHHALILGVRREITRRFRQEIVDGVRAGVFDPVDVPAATTALLSMCIDVARWYQPRRNRSPEMIGTQYAELALRMLGSTG